MTHRDAATFTDYETNVKEFEAFTGGLTISQICPQTITDFICHLTKKGNTPPTIDKKIGSLRALFNYGKKQKLKVSGENFAANRNLVSKSEKEAGGHKFYELDEVKEVLGCEAFKKLAKDGRNFYLIMLAELVTGIRISALAALTAADCRTSIDDHPYFRIDDDKTPSGERSVPVPGVLHAPIKAYLTEHGSFGFVERNNGKGASDPVRKALQIHLDAIGAAGRNFTIHGLRKTLNAYLFQKLVPFEARCQIMGHKISHVNVGVYLPGSTSQKYALDELATLVNEHQLKLLKIVGFV
jgi:integrase